MKIDRLLGRLVLVIGVTFACSPSIRGLCRVCEAIIAGILAYLCRPLVLRIDLSKLRCSACVPEALASRMPDLENIVVL